MGAHEIDPLPPASGTLERWAWDYVVSTDAATKLDPVAPDLGAEACFEVDAAERRLSAPGRPPAWQVVSRHARTPSAASLGNPKNRAKLVLTFAHHEVQAAELMAWAILAFPTTPREFRAGLARLVVDEARHARAYVAHARTLGMELGDHPVRDWFWERVGSVRAPAQFVALLGLGFEAANLDHSARYAALFRAAGDEAGARLQEAIGAEERLHVRFAARWFEHFAGALDFETWLAHLPRPLTPMVLRGKPYERGARLASGLPADFVDALERWQPAGAGA
ncbi:MAG TPA: DUF455 family protein [Planctomycetota bacterium]|nr:DUF455 family protein [Planctomycetota bacterium]